MRKNRLIFLGIISLLGVMPALATQVDFRMSAPKLVELGEQFRLTLTLNGEGEEVSLPELSDFNLLMGPSTTQSVSVEFINGNSKKNVTSSYSYVLQAKKEGVYTIGSASIKVGGERYTSNPVTLEVVKGSSKPSGGGVNEPAVQSGVISKEDLFVKVFLNKKSVFKGEHIVATIKIFSKVELTRLGNIKLPSFEGFWLQDIETPQQISLQREAYNGEIYNVGVLKKAVLFPQHSGEIKIEPAEIECFVRQRVSHRSRNFFDDFFNSYSTVRVTALSPPASVKVKPHPTPPAGFSGGVGDFSFTASISDTNVKENDAITLKFKITGNGNIKLINGPKVNLPPDFEAYDPKTASDYKASEEGLKGSITFEHLFLPRYAGDYAIPPVEFTYFNPSLAKYVTKKSSSFALHVEKGEGEHSSGMIQSVSRESVRFIGKDIRYIKQGTGKLYVKGYIFFGSLRYYLIHLGGLFLLLFIYFLNRKRIKERANIAKHRNRKAARVAKKHLRGAKEHLSKREPESFYESVMRAFWGYLSDKLTIPVSELNRERASEVLSERGVSRELIAGFMKVLDACEFARFAPSGSVEQMGGVYEDASEVMNKMEREIG